jgi:hypothetical protein
MSLDFLIVYQSNNPKIRIGSKNDGGYIIASNIEYDHIISCGIADDITFEKDFLDKYPHVRCTAYDGTINDLPEKHPRIDYIKKNISYYNSNTKTNLHDIISQYSNIFLKMDIESYEYRWIHTLSLEQLTKFKQIVIEIHFPFNNINCSIFDAPLPVDEKFDSLRKLAETHTLIHLHPNNNCGISIFEGHVVPNVFECTYVRKDIQKPILKNRDIIPTILDSPNINAPDIYLYDYPFVER